MVANAGRVQFGVPVKSRSHGTGALGRVCGAYGCTTVLSIYNRSEECALHEHRSLKPQRDRI